MGREQGTITLAHVYAVALSLVFFTVVANLVVHQYGHGALVAVVDESARIGARTTASDEAATDACLAAARRVADGLLGARLGEDIEFGCTAEPDVITASAAATLRGWLAIVPDWRVEVHATAVREFAP